MSSTRTCLVSEILRVFGKLEHVVINEHVATVIVIMATVQDRLNLNQVVRMLK